MDYLYHSANISDQVQELPIRITNSFPPRGIVAKILANESNKADTLCLYGNFISSPLNHRRSHWSTNKTQPMDTKTSNNGFSPPPTITEIKSLTRKTPRFYTVDSSILKHENGENLPTVDKLIANSELTGLKEVYQKVCKGNMDSLKSLISRGQIYQKFAFLQTSYPSRYYQKGRPSTVGNFGLGNDEQKLNTNSQSAKEQSVLVPSPYFRHQSTSGRQSAPEMSSPYIYSMNKGTRQCASPIEPTVINLNNKLPELPRNDRLHERFKTKNIRGVRKRRGEGTVAVFADRSTRSASSSVSPDNDESPHVKNKHILYGKSMTKNEKMPPK